MGGKAIVCGDGVGRSVGMGCKTDGLGVLGGDRNGFWNVWEFVG